jgi:hypothetical protein
MKEEEWQEIILPTFISVTQAMKEDEHAENSLNFLIRASENCQHFRDDVPNDCPLNPSGPKHEERKWHRQSHDVRSTQPCDTASAQV